MEKKIRIFISGAVTGNPGANRQFLDAETALKANGFSVINPLAIHNRMPEDCTYQEYMDISMELLKMSDAIFLLTGGEESNGSITEFDYMVAVGKPVYFQEAGYPKAETVRKEIRHGTH